MLPLIKITSIWQHRSTSFSLATVYRDDAGLLAKKTGSCCEGICFLSNATNQSVLASSWCNFLSLTSTLEWRTSCWSRGCNTSADRGAWVELGWKLGLIKSPALCTSAHDVSRTVPQCSATERYVWEAISSGNIRFRRGQRREDETGIMSEVFLIQAMLYWLRASLSFKTVTVTC